MIYEKLTQFPLEKCLSDVFLPFPSYTDRAKWDAVSEDARSYYLQKGKELKNKNWDSLPASHYLNFVRTGDRTVYERLYFQRRRDLFTLMIAECLEGKKEYVDDIINAVWLICEESTWVVPAHNNNLKTSGEANGLVNIEEPVNIDLFAAETGALLAWVYYFVGDLLAEVSPLIKKRIVIETEKRIINPFLDDDFPWMGLSHNNPVNNWNPWINANILVVFLIIAECRNLKQEGVEKTIKSIDRFLYFYNEDGGCDEGPGYFGVAGAALLDFLEELTAATGSAFDIYNSEKIRNMAAYIYRAYIGQSYFVNFADAHARISAPAGLMYRTGKKTGDDNLTGFAQYLMENEYTNRQYENTHWILFRVLTNIFQTQAGGYHFLAPKKFWFDGISVLTARDAEGALDGMFVAAKGGHNGESHNHNDIGNFVLYCNAEPVIIDAGVGTYSKKTFSTERYNIWTMQSRYHNTPTINGCDQLPGCERSASSVNYSDEGNVTALSMDIKDAYPEEAGIKSYVRSFRFTHGESLEVKDKYKLSKCDVPLAVNLLAYLKPVLEYGRVVLNESVVMVYDGNVFRAETEEIPLTDATLQKDWEKDTLYRLVLTQKEMKAFGEFTLRFVRAY